MKFFDSYKRFYETSITSPFPDRLNGRYEAIIEKNATSISGAKVLDIASHDGRWSFAALQAGAKFVKGIEPRQELITNAINTFSSYKINPARYAFICGSIFDCLVDESFDVVLCLGYFYHTIRHAELLDRIERTGAKLVVIDTEVVPPITQNPLNYSNDPRLVFDNPYAIQLLTESVDDQQMASVDTLSRDGRTLVGRPSKEAIRYMSSHFGYDISAYDWSDHFQRNPEHVSSMSDYHQKWRETFYLSRL